MIRVICGGLGFLMTLIGGISALTCACLGEDDYLTKSGAMAGVGLLLLCIASM